MHADLLKPSLRHWPLYLFLGNKSSVVSNLSRAISMEFSTSAGSQHNHASTITGAHGALPGLPGGASRYNTIGIVSASVHAGSKCIHSGNIVR